MGSGGYPSLGILLELSVHVHSILFMFGCVPIPQRCANAVFVHSSGKNQYPGFIFSVGIEVVHVAESCIVLWVWFIFLFVSHNFLFLASLLSFQL